MQFFYWCSFECILLIGMFWMFPWNWTELHCFVFWSRIIRISYCENGHHFDARFPRNHFIEVILRFIVLIWLISTEMSDSAFWVYFSINRNCNVYNSWEFIIQTEWNQHLRITIFRLNVTWMDNIWLYSNCEMRCRKYRVVLCHFP